MEERSERCNAFKSVEGSREPRNEGSLQTLEKARKQILP